MSSVQAPKNRSSSSRSRRGRIAIAIACAVVAALVVHDAAVAVPSQYSTRALVFSIEQYRAHVSKTIGRHVTCRFQPTCSKYGLESVKKYGALRGGFRAGWRILRCGPWTPMGTVDPP